MSIGTQTADFRHSAVKAFQSERKDTSTAIVPLSLRFFMYDTSLHALSAVLTSILGIPRRNHRQVRSRSHTRKHHPESSRRFGFQIFRWRFYSFLRRSSSTSLLQTCIHTHSSWRWIFRIQPSGIAGSRTSSWRKYGWRRMGC